MTTPADHKHAAIEQLHELRQAVEALPAEAGGLEVIELIGHLERAIQAFHMEGIRFRMYTIGRRLGPLTEPSPAVTARFEQLRASLEAAGFHTRSVS